MAQHTFWNHRWKIRGTYKNFPTSSHNYLFLLFESEVVVIYQIEIVKMKFITVLLAVLAVFSSVVLSQKVDPLASSSVVGTAKEEEVSPMVKTFSDALSSISSESTQLIDQTTTPPLDSNVDTRQLNECMTFAYSPGTNPDIVQDDYVEVGGVTTLDEYCNSNNCCNQNDYYDDDVEVEYYDDQACGGWSKDSTVQYTVCRNSCIGPFACYAVANKAASHSSIKFESGSCSDTSTEDLPGYSCYEMAHSTTKKLNLFVGEGSCSDVDSCYDMAGLATNLEELSIGKGSCTNRYSCESAAYNAQSLKQLIIDNNQCQSSCKNCGRYSTFDEALKLTETCCAQNGNADTECQYREPSASPSISSIPSSVPSLSSIPSDQPSNVPSWLDDEQCKKKDPENDICAELDGRCKVDCEDDDNFVCVPGLCSYNKKWDKPTKSPKMRQLMNKDVEIVDMQITATGNAERKLKATKAPKSSCACRVPKRNRCN